LLFFGFHATGGADMVTPGERVTVPWGLMSGPAAALLWFEQHPDRAAARVRLNLERRLACWNACVARAEVLSGSTGRMTLAVACFGWPDERDLEWAIDLDQDEIEEVKAKWKGEQIDQALRVGPIGPD